MADVNIPNEYDITLHGIPSSYNITADAGLDDVRIKEIPKIVLESTSTLNTDNSISITRIPDINLNTDSNIRITEIPDIRAHLPVNFNFGVSLLGLELLVFSLCGELQLITEKYVPNRRERCEHTPCDP